MHRKEKIADSELKQIVPMLAKAHTCLVPHTCPALHAHTLMPLHPVCPCAGTCLDRRPPPFVAHMLARPGSLRELCVACQIARAGLCE